MKSIRIFIVDDSATVRQVLSGVLEDIADITVIGSAADPIFALDKMQKDWPDVIILDVEMPRMDGITFLKKIMAERPTPVIICSTLTETGTTTAMQAMSAGAVNIVTKPKIGLKQFLLEAGEELVSAIRAATHANVRHLAVPPHARPAAVMNKINVPLAPITAMAETTEKVVAIGASTGGTQALESVLTGLPAVCPGIVIVQHMPAAFTAAFAGRLNQVCAIEVREACNGDRVTPGKALIAPGGRHMQLKRSGAYYYVEVLDGPPVNRHRPSVDVLFRSVARWAGSNALGIIMTGMGDDGARGMKDMFDAGAMTLAQDEHSCVVYGMPKEAVKLGGVGRSVSLDNFAGEIIQYAKERT
ncbi:MAG TPA: chemotaxis response regulator protein-glutamate methylesterase [Rhodocyclaceae bacterium]|nr:chemotaxis response regulator protein-glutamate methylesterase [Rhodocyclaceae bacterium]